MEFTAKKDKVVREKLKEIINESRKFRELVSELPDYRALLDSAREERRLVPELSALQRIEQLALDVLVEL